MAGRLEVVVADKLDSKVTMWPKFSASIQDFEAINKAARWNYQRDRIYIRTDTGLKTAKRWWVDMAAAKNGSILQVHHPVHGWLAFVFPPEHAATLGVALVRHSALCEYFAGTHPPSTGTVN
jgi:hypothetical protein